MVNVINISFNMNKEEYLEKIKQINDLIKQQELEKVKLKRTYIEINKFCERDKKVKIELNSGRIVEGLVHSFDVFRDKNVYVSSYINDRNVVLYITVPYKRIKLME